MTTLAIFGCPNWGAIRSDLIVVGISVVSLALCIGFAYCAEKLWQRAGSRPGSAFRKDGPVGNFLCGCFLTCIGLLVLLVIGNAVFHLVRRWWGC